MPSSGSGQVTFTYSCSTKIRKGTVKVTGGSTAEVTVTAQRETRIFKNNQTDISNVLDRNASLNEKDHVYGPYDWQANDKFRIEVVGSIRVDLPNNAVQGEAHSVSTCNFNWTMVPEIS